MSTVSDIGCDHQKYWTRLPKSENTYKGLLHGFKCRASQRIEPEKFYNPANIREIDRFSDNGILLRRGIMLDCLDPADDLDGVFFHPELPVHVNKQADLPAYLNQLALERIGDLPIDAVQCENMLCEKLFLWKPHHRLIHFLKRDNQTVQRSVLNPLADVFGGPGGSNCVVPPQGENEENKSFVATSFLKNKTRTVLLSSVSAS
ncbi:uncharacterized protein TNCV_1764871 [Trichonephila clavipes]|nr:uncharacterized protein TNCV_1764871 [Trichonephila clavipes]